MNKIRIFQKENPEENKILRKISKEIKKEDIQSPLIQKIATKMLSFIVIQPDGAALAAPQIGENVRMFIVAPKIFQSIDRKVSEGDLVFINPKIVKKSKKMDLLEEGCFSVRWYYGKVDRYRNITIEAYNQHGVKKTWGAGGLLAQVFQHEIEHLDGVLFCDKAHDLMKISDEEIAEMKRQQKKMAG